MTANKAGRFLWPIFIFFAGCTMPDKKQAAYSSPFNRDSLAAHIIVLSSDSFEGRKPFSAGEDKTVDYLKKQFTSMGLEPGNGNSFFQEVPLVEITSTPDPVMKVESPKGPFELKNHTDYVLVTQDTGTEVSLKSDELVFVGYGVVAPEYHWNDYAGTDVKGKVVLLMVNDPGYGTADTTIFKGKTMTYYGRWTYKYEEAARQGARGVLVIHNTAAASYPFSVVQSSWGSSGLYLDERANPVYHCPFEGWVSAEAAKKLLAAAGKDSSLLMAANRPGFKAVSLHEKLSTTIHIKTLYRNSRNVIARITGSKRPGEYIIYTAHWDHFGIGQPDKKGDSIYNGALDNASGTAALLEIARAFQNNPVKPERSILFLAVTSEEQGLLGSEYYCAHPLYPLNKTVGVLNMDVINPNGVTRDVVIAGMGQNDLEDLIDTVAREQGRYLAPESHPEAGHYFRSDHFSFAKKGVPALSVGSGIDDEKHGKEYGRRQEEFYTMNRYHQPSDEYDPAWTFEGALKDLDLLYRTGERLAMESSWPGWKPGSEFKQVREQSLQAP